MLQDLFQLLFSLVPHLNVSNKLLGTSGKFHLESETKDAIHVVHELNAVENFLTNLIAGAENMGIVLLETTDTSQTSQGTRQLISES